VDVQCPRCGSQSVRRSSRVGAFERLISVVYVYPFRCQRCTFRFRRLNWGHRYPNSKGDRRDYERVVVRLPARLTAGAESAEAETTDLSISGCAVRTSARFPPGTDVRVIIELGGGRTVDVAEAVVRANHKLRKYGYGLLIHDAYRPWYVTKVFWDATPDDKKIFVADPSKGSRHNRGCAVDLTLYDLKTGKAVEMVSTYDETTDRAHADYPGGTSLQRWHRKLLREAMEAEGFAVYPPEWWHFDYKDWQKYRIGNVRFEQIGRER